MQTLIFSLSILFFITLVIFLTGVFVRRMTYRAVAKIEKAMIDTEYILDTGKVPADWIEKSIAKRNVLQSDESIRYMKSKAISKLKKLIIFHRTSMLPDCDETKELLIRRLKDIHRNWQQMTWDDMKGS